MDMKSQFLCYLDAAIVVPLWVMTFTNFIWQSSFISYLVICIRMCRGGIVCWADIVGAKYIVSRLNTWTKAYGDFFKPCTFLEERAATGVKLVFFSLWDVVTFCCYRSVPIF